VLPEGFVEVGRVEGGPGDARPAGVTVDGVARLDAGGWVHYPTA